MASRKYTNARGERVPGVTTVIGRFTEAGGLVHSAWDIAYQGLLDFRFALREMTEGSVSDQGVADLLSEPLERWQYREVWGQKANAGTLAHDMVEAHIFGRPEPDTGEFSDEVVHMARTSFNAFLEWSGQSRLAPLEGELEMVSESLQVGGRLDAVLVNNKVAIGDWKTGAGLYTDALVQVRTYGYMYEEATGQKVDGGYHLFRFDRETAGFRHFYFRHDELDEALELFRLYRRAYEINKLLKKAIK